MYESTLIITKQEHKDSCVKTINDSKFAKKLNSCLLALDEYLEACKDYPILFAKDSNGIWFASALLGIKDGDNLFVDESGMWEARRYIPAFVRRYPFIFASLENKELALALDDKCLEPKNESNSNRALFNEDGELSKFASDTLGFMNSYQLGLERSKAFIEDLDFWELLEEKSLSLTLNDSGENFVINGFFTINEEKFNLLSEKKKESICKKGAIPFITAHLISLSNFSKFQAISTKEGLV